MIEMSALTLTHSVTNCVIRNSPSFNCSMRIASRKMRRDALQAGDSPPDLGRGTPALDSIRRAGHQQLGRVKNICSGGIYAALVWEHKDHVVLSFHRVSIIV